MAKLKKKNPVPSSRRHSVSAPAARADIYELDSSNRLFEKVIAKYRKSAKTRNALTECLRLIEGKGRSDVQQLLSMMAPEWSDYSIASIYTLLIPNQKRKRLGAYFTPPHLVQHLVRRMTECGMDPVNDRISDPAAGGAAFLVPLARIKVTAWRRSGLTDSRIITKLIRDLIGREIEPGLAKIANALLRRMLVKEFNIPQPLVKNLNLIRLNNSLTNCEGIIGKIDHEVGNPPFLRLSRDNQKTIQSKFADISCGRLNLYTMFLRRALDEVPTGGFVGYIVPSSFLGGPEFAAFRKRILQLAEVKIIDVIDKRSDLFLEATQDACFIVLKRRRSELPEPETSSAKTGVLHSNGSFSQLGETKINPAGPWQLPGKSHTEKVTLLSLGYRGTIGYLVANRQGDRLYPRPAKNRFPLIWAKSITPEGAFDFSRGMTFKGTGWASAPADAPYIVRQACVAVQRTSARGQKKRITAAVIPANFIEQYGGVIGENHVIFLLPSHKDAVGPEVVADILNSLESSVELDRVCGSASISVRVLENIPLQMK